jgi:hypothetical protein
MADILKFDVINSMPRPIIATFYGGDEWEVESIEVQTGLMRIFVCGLLQVMHFGDVKSLKDGDGIIYISDDIYHD